MNKKNYIFLNNFLSKFHIVYKSFKPEKVIAFWLLLTISFLFFFAALINYNKQFLLPVPAYGGTVKEGLVGTPRYINPILATSDQDKDLVSLVFAGITKKDSTGNFVPDVAESITESEDKLHYTITLKEGAKFHDGKKLTTDDVIFTINLIQNPIIKSPRKVEWEGVEIEKIDDKTLVFSLRKPYPLFFNALSVGILPKHVWKNLTDEQISLSDYNINAIGSGPYKIKNIVSDSGIPTSFRLVSYDFYTLGRPYISEIEVTTYSSEKYLLKAFEDGDISRIHGISTEKLKQLNVSEKSIETSLLPRTFVVFFNPNKNSTLSDKNVRAALQMSINKQAILDTVLNKYGKVINNPYPFDSDDSSTHEYNPEKAKKLLLSNKNLKKASSTLEINLTTANIDEMKLIAEMVKSDWEKIGVLVTLSVYEVTDLNQSVIKDRDFQALLFGTITQEPSDLYAFWHSSQRNYPGLNISNYVSKKLDTNLEILRESTNEEEKSTAYNDVKAEFRDEVPGIFLFAPSLIYVNNDDITSPLPTYSSDNSSRFALVESWYKHTDYVWPKTYYKPLLELVENIIH